jgi:hypothetical protein
MAARKPNPQDWTPAEVKELLRGWDAGESFTGIAIRLVRTFRVVYTRNMVAQQCRDRGMRRPKNYRAQRMNPELLSRFCAGLKPRWDHARMPRDEREILDRSRALERSRQRLKVTALHEWACELRERGLSYAQISRTVGRCESWVQTACLIGGAFPPGVSGPQRRRGKTSDETIGQILEMRRDGFQVGQIARRFGLCHSTVSHHLAAQAARDEAMEGGYSVAAGSSSTG